MVAIVLEEAAKLGVSLIEFSLTWNLARPSVVAPIIGQKSVAQLQTNLAALDVTVPVDAI